MTVIIICRLCYVADDQQHLAAAEICNLDTDDPRHLGFILGQWEEVETCCSTFMSVIQTVSLVGTVWNCSAPNISLICINIDFYNALE